MREEKLTSWWERLALLNLAVSTGFTVYDPTTWRLSMWVATVASTVAIFVGGALVRHYKEKIRRCDEEIRKLERRHGNPWER